MELNEIRDPAFLKTLNNSQLKDLAEQIRKFLIYSLSKTGGHLASNLGIVELTIALHYVFDSPKDKIIFESGILHLLLVKSGKYSQEREYRIIKRFNKKNTLKIGNKIFYTERSDNLKEISLFIFRKFEDMNLNKKEEVVLLRILHEAFKNENRIFFLNKKIYETYKSFFKLRRILDKIEKHIKNKDIRILEEKTN